MFPSEADLEPPLHDRNPFVMVGRSPNAIGNRAEHLYSHAAVISVYTYIYTYTYTYTYIYILFFYLFLLGSSARSARTLFPCGPPWTLLGLSFCGPAGPLWARPVWTPLGHSGLPWALVGQALAGGPLWAHLGPCGHPWALVGRDLVGRALVGPAAPLRAGP